jgi:hypothetical protein
MNETETEKIIREYYNSFSILPPKNVKKLPEGNRGSMVYKISKLLEIVPSIIYVKIWDSKILDFIIIGEQKYNLNNLYKSLYRLCESDRNILDCEFLINYITPYPILKKQYCFDKYITLFSTYTNDDFEDLPFPSFIDFDRINDRVFGIKLPNSVIWEFKKYNFCLGIGTDNLKTNDEILKYLDLDWAVFKTIDNTYKEYNSVSRYKFVLLYEDYVEISDIMFTASCLLIINANFRYWFNIKPWVHYIPVYDFKDLFELKNWCLNNDKFCENIGLNARHFAINNLNTNSVFDYIRYSFEETTVLNYYNTISEIQANFQLEYIINNNFSFLTENNKLDLFNLDKNLKLVDKYSWEENVTIKLLFNNNFEKFSELGKFYDVYEYTNFFDGLNDAYTGYILNDLCREIPNFRYTYFCKVFPDHKIKIFKEKIKGDTLDKFLKNNNNVLEIFIQIFLSLQMAWENYGFEHGNLNVKNIKIVESKVPQKIHYQLSEKLFVIITNFVVVIEDFSNSKCISELNKKGKMILSGRSKELDNKFKLPDNFEDFMIPKTYRDIKNLNNSMIKSKITPIIPSSLNIVDKEPISIMNKTIPPSEIRSKKIKFGSKNPEDIEPYLKPLGSPRLLYDQLTGSKEPHKEVANRMMENSLPFSNNTVGNIVLQYEMTHTLKTSLFNLNTRHTVNLGITKFLEKYLNIIKDFYDDLISQSDMPDFDSEVDPWPLKMFLRKYSSILGKNPSYIKILNKFLFIMMSTLKIMINNSLKNTRELYS